MKQTLSILTLAGTFTFFGVGAASAVNSYPSPAPGIVSTENVAPGTGVTFSGSGILPAEPVTVAVDLANNTTAILSTGVNSPIIPARIVDTRTVTADPSGAFTTHFTLMEEGTYTLTATGMTSGQTVSASVVVNGVFAADASSRDTAAGESEARESSLAVTGADSAMLLWGAAGLVGLGAGITSLTVARHKNF